jgi:hypothetical protein
MTADEVAAVRSSFLRSIDRFGVQNGLQRAADETPTTFRFRLEEVWMDAQGEFEVGRKNRKKNNVARQNKVFCSAGNNWDWD